MCDGLKRLLVHESRFDELIEKLSHKIKVQKVGDAQDESTDV